jgi:hypothetical protein
MTAIFMLGLALYSSYSAYLVVNDMPTDYYCYVVAAYAFSHGINIYPEPDETYYAIARQLGIPYVPTPYVYPPFTALVVWPLTLLPLRVGAALWEFGSGTAALVAALLLSADAGAAWRRRLILVSAIAFLPFFDTLRLGQINNFVLLLTAAALYFWRRHKEGLGGALVAAGVWFKPLGFALVCLLAFRARWRALAGVAIATLIIIAAGLAAFGLGPTLTQLEPYSPLLQDPATGFPAFVGKITDNDATLTDLQNNPDLQNLLSLLSRWLRPHDFGQVVVNAPQMVLPVYWTLSLILVGASLALLWPFGRHLQLFEGESALFVITTLLVSPVTEIHQFAMSFLGFAVLAQDWQNFRRPRWDTVALATAYIMTNLGFVVVRRELFGQTLLLDLAAWGQIILWVLLAFKMYKRRQLLARGLLQNSTQTKASNNVEPKRVRSEDALFTNAAS